MFTKESLCAIKCGMTIKVGGFEKSGISSR